MEASRFGFGRDFAAAFKFDPTDADIVAFYLLPRAVGLDKPHPHDHAHAVIDDDPISLPPWDLMEKHNHGTSDQAFFFGPPRNGGRVTRVVPGEGGGTWQGQNGSVGTVTLFCDSDGAGAGEVDISYRRYDLTYKRAGDKEPSGWVMSEYQITSPPLLSTVLTRIGLNVAAREQRRRRLANPEALAQQGPDKVLAAAAAATAEHQRVSPAPVQPGPEPLTRKPTMVLSTMAVLASPAWGRWVGTTLFRFCSTAKSTTRTRAASNDGDMDHEPS